jgi:hypothetical protein
LQPRDAHWPIDNLAYVVSEGSRGFLEWDLVARPMDGRIGLV